MNQDAAKKKPVATGYLHHMSAGAAKGAADPVMGTFSFNPVPATILFDSGVLF